MPKRCGYMTGKDVIALADMVAKLRAAVDARSDLLIVARTDALAIEGMDGAIERAQAYAECGVDALFVEGAHTAEELAEVNAAVPSLPLLVNRSQAANGVDGLPTREELHACGVRIVIHPVAALLAAAEAARAAYDELYRTHAVSSVAVLSWDALNDLLGLPAAAEDERRYASDPQPLATERSLT